MTTKRRAKDGTTGARRVTREGDASAREARADAPGQQDALALDPQDTREWLLMALESAGVGSWDWDLETDVVRYVSPFTGGGIRSLPLRQASGSSWFSTTHPDDIVAMRPRVDAVIEGSAESFDMVVRATGAGDAPGRLRHLHSRGRAIERDASGRALRMVGVFEDVTDRVMREREEREKERMLSQAGRLASLAALATSVAHELNQPLAALTSYLEASKRLLANPRPELGEIAGAIDRSVALAGRASEIVRRLRRLLRRELPLQETIDCPAMLETLRASMSREAAAAGVAIEVEGGAGPFSFRGDSVQIEQALANLVRNSIEAFGASRARAPVIRLAARLEGEVVRLSVEDNGPGVRPNDESRIFEPFFTTKSNGTGLGLVIAHSVAEVHGGSARMERTGADGTTFVIEIPVSQERRA